MISGRSKRTIEAVLELCEIALSIATLIETAKMNGVEPYAYLKATLEAIATGHPASRIDELLPWAFTPAPR